MSPGFTLLEVLVALTLLGLLAVLLTSGMSFGVRVWERSTSGDRASGDLLSTYRFLDDQLRAAALIPEPGQQNRPDMSFVGSSGSLRFTTTGLSRVGLAAPTGIEISLVGNRLTAQIAALDGAASSPARSDITLPFTLLRGVKELTFSYQTVADNGAAKPWQAGWPKSNKLPRLVRVALQREEGPELDWVFRLADPDLR